MAPLQPPPVPNYIIPALCLLEEAASSNTIKSANTYVPENIFKSV